MHRSYAAIVTLSVALATLMACDDVSRPPAPTQPAQAISALKPGTSACQTTLEKQISTEIGALYTSPDVTKQAKAYFDAIVLACQSGTADAQAVAREKMFAYVDFTIDQARAGAVTSNSLVVSHWNTLFSYVFLTAPNADAGVLGPKGGANVVFKGQNGYVVRADGEAGSYIRAQTNDQSSHLHTILDASTRAVCVTSELEKFETPCDEFNVYPTTSFNPLAVVMICEAVDAIPATPTSTVALAHQPADGKTRLTNALTAAEAALFDGTTAPTLCHGAPPTSQLGSADGAVRQGWRAMTRLASRAVEALGPKPLYGFFGGPTLLGGSGGGYSPFGGVNRVNFYSSLSAYDVGTSFVVGPTYAADRGTFTVETLTNPSSITVEQSLGDLTDRPLVLRQGGGNCTKSCGGLLLTNRLATPNGTLPTYGQNLLSWYSLQANPTLKVAPFVARSSDLKQIATVAYTTGMNNAPYIFYNGQQAFYADDSNHPPVLWVQNFKQYFELTVDLDGYTTSLKIDGRPVGYNVKVGSSVEFVTSPKFVDALAKNLAYLRAEYTGIDAGTVGWDYIRQIRNYELVP